jgi:type II secretory pathway pseudopilin PulG
MRKRAFSLTEVLVGAVILAATFGSLLSSFVAARNYSVRATQRLVAANIARDTLSSLYPQISANTWSATFGSGNYPLAAINVEAVPYTRSYTVTNLGKEYRQVTVQVQYP